jgi:tRNA(Ser,Leu) C12 N-acetylase TAN1
MSYEEREKQFNNLIENVKNLLKLNNNIVENEIFTKISNLLTFDFEVNYIIFSITYYHKKEEDFYVFLNYKDFPIICTDSHKNIVNKIIEILNEKKIINFNDWNMNYL